MKLCIPLFIIFLLSALPLKADISEYDKQGDAYLTENKYHEAIDCFWLSIRSDPVQAYPYSKLAIAYMAIGMRKEAEVMEKQAKALEEHQKWINKGDEQYSKEKYVEAIASYEKALEYFPESYVACEKLGLTYDKIGQKEKSHDMYKKSHELLMAKKTRLSLEKPTEITDTKELERIRQEWAFAREEELLRRKFEEDAGYEMQLSMPLRTGNNNLFHSLVYVPPMEGASTIPKHSAYINVNFDVSKGSFSETGNWNIFYNHRLLEPNATVSYGLREDLEVRFSLSLPTLQDISSYGVLIEHNNTSYVADAKRSWGISDFVPSLKFQIHQAEDSISGISAVAALKIPLADKYNFVSSGGADLSLNLVATKKVGSAYYHFNLGYTLLGEPNVFEEQIEFDDIISFGAGYVLKMTDNFSLDLQLQGNTNAFSGMGDYTGLPLNFIAGGKYHAEYFLLEFGIGTGLGNISSDFTATVGLTTKF